MTTTVGTVPDTINAVSHDISEPSREIHGFALLRSQQPSADSGQQFWTDLGHRPNRGVAEIEYATGIATSVALTDNRADHPLAPTGSGDRAGVLDRADSSTTAIITNRPVAGRGRKGHR